MLSRTSFLIVNTPLIPKQSQTLDDIAAVPSLSLILFMNLLDPTYAINNAPQLYPDIEIDDKFALFSSLLL